MLYDGDLLTCLTTKVQPIIVNRYGKIFKKSNFNTKETFGTLTLQKPCQVSFHVQVNLLYVTSIEQKK